MNIIEEWDLDEDVYGGVGDQGVSSARLAQPADGGLESILDGGTSSLRERPIFSVEVMERNISRGRGAVSAVATASDCVVVGTTRGYLLRYDFSQGSAPVAEIELSKAPSAVVSSVFLDPTATHVIACVSSDSGAAVENHYVHAKWKKSRLMSKLKGIPVTAVAWSDTQLVEQSTGPILVGTKHGSLAELQVDEKDKKEKHFKHLCSVGDSREQICSVAFAESPGQLVVFAVTPTRLYLFKGSKSLEALFAVQSTAKKAVPPLIELPGDATHRSELHVHPGGERFSWLAQPGIYVGRLAPNGAELAEGHELLPFPGDGRPGDTPLSMAETDHHLLLLYKTRLLAINKVSRNVIQDVPLVGAAARGLAGMPLGLSVDRASWTVFMYTGEALHEVSIRDEARDMWKTYLSMGDYQQAAAHCLSPEQKSAVWTEQAENAFANGEYLEAARFFASLGSSKPSFEEIALRFVEIGDPTVLHEFLIRKLEALATDDRAQSTMVATWLTELQLDQINRALLDDEGEAGPECQALIEKLKGFLTEYRDVLDDATTSNLLASYGRLDELMHFAAMQDDNETVIEHLMQRGEVVRALGVLRRPNISLELVYKFAPVLLAAAPSETVDAWIKTGSRLDPRRLMPALLRCDEPSSGSAMRLQGLRYIEHCIHSLSCDDTAIHNLAVSLYSAQDEEMSLISHLKQAKGPLGRPLYDQKFALRIARERNRMRACVQLLSDMGMYQDATILAIQVDIGLAKEVAERPEDDEPLRRKLWLTIARHLVDGGKDSRDQGDKIRQAVAFVKEAGGLLKIEDILPFFPDFVHIDEFKDAICSSLEEYNRQIEDLKSEMDRATDIADALRKDLSALEGRAAVVDPECPCERCGRPVAASPPPSAGPSGGCQQPFYVFPCSSVFHTACLVQEVAELVGTSKANVAGRLAARLAAAPSGSATSPAGQGQEVESVQGLLRQLERHIGAECPRCGEMVVKMIDRPLVTEGEEEAASWAIVPN